MRSLDYLLAGSAVALGACLLLGAGSASVSRQILVLEQQRSLGNGTLGSLLASPDEATAARAALAIGRTKRTAGVPLLEGHMSDGRTSVRAMSIYGLGLIGLGSQAERIAKAADGDPSGAVRVAALDALGRYEAGKRLDPTTEALAAKAVIAALDNDADAVVRGRAAITLNFFADGPQSRVCADALMAAMRRERGQSVRERAMWSIFRRYATNVPRSALRTALHDNNEVVRIEAVRAYGKLKDSAAIADVKPLLHDPSWRVQEQAGESILALQGKALTQHWAAIPSYVHLPARRADSLAGLPALARPAAGAGAPQPARAIFEPQIEPHTASEMVSAAHGAHPRLRIVTTKGTIYVVLYPEWAPLTVGNFLNLANRGFFDDNRWFRIVPDFVVQTGEKDDKKAPGPGYSIGAEENPLEQNSYVISMGLNYDSKTNTPLRDSAGSEYYVTLSPQYHLDNDFTVFGAVTSGYDVLARLVEADRVVRIERISDATL